MRKKIVQSSNKETTIMYMDLFLGSFFLNFAQRLCLSNSLNA